jgi:hypothetical protein
MNSEWVGFGGLVITPPPLLLHLLPQGHSFSVSIIDEEFKIAFMVFQLCP